MSRLSKLFSRKLGLINKVTNSYSTNYIRLLPETQEKCKTPCEGPTVCSYKPVIIVSAGIGFTSSAVCLAMYPQEVQMHVFCNKSSKEHEQQGPIFNSQAGSVDQVDWRTMRVFAYFWYCMLDCAFVSPGGFPAFHQMHGGTSNKEK